MIESVKITAADFNGSSWDSSPFDQSPHWLIGALSRKLIDVEPGSEDYAWFRITTPQGDRIVGPGDEIVRGEEGAIWVRYSSDDARRRFGHKFGPELFEPTPSPEITHERE